MFEQEDFNPEEHEDEEFNQKLELFGDKETLGTTLDKYKDYMEAQIMACEKDIKRRIKTEWESIEKRIVDNQHSRNRSIVKEIIETCADFRNTLHD